MAVGVAPVQRRDPLSKLLPIGGAIVGGATAGPGGAAAGASAGAAAGGQAAGVLGPGAAPPPVQTSEASGMARRRDALGQDPVRAIAEAQAALQTLPPEQLPEVRRAFEEAQALAQRNQQLGAQGRVV